MRLFFTLLLVVSGFVVNAIPTDSSRNVHFYLFCTPPWLPFTFGIGKEIGNGIFKKYDFKSDERETDLQILFNIGVVVRKIKFGVCGTINDFNFDTLQLKNSILPFLAHKEFYTNHDLKNKYVDQTQFKLGVGYFYKYGRFVISPDFFSGLVFSSDDNIFTIHQKEKGSNYNITTTITIKKYAGFVINPGIYLSYCPLKKYSYFTLFTRADYHTFSAKTKMVIKSVDFFQNELLNTVKDVKIVSSRIGLQVGICLFI